MRRITRRFYDKICISGLRLEQIEQEIDAMPHQLKAQYGTDGSMFTTPYKMAKEIINELKRRNLIIKVNGKYVKQRQNSTK